MDVTTRPRAACECVGWGWVHGDVLRYSGLVAPVECTPVREARIPCNACTRSNGFQTARRIAVVIILMYT